MLNWQLILSLLILGLIPAFFWLYIYYLKDYVQPEPRRLIAKTFLYGMLVAAPLIFLQLARAHNPNWDLYALVDRFVPYQYLAAIVFYILVAYIEEYLKHIGMVALVEKHEAEFDQIVDGIEYAVASALGFAFIENVVYFWSAYQSTGAGQSFLLIFLVRALLSTLSHSVFSGYFGYFYARAKLDHQVHHDEHEKLTHFNRNLLKGGWKLHIFRSHIIPQRPSRSKHHPALLVAEGFFLATGMHLIYNVLFSIKFGFYSFAWLTVPLLFLAAYYLFCQFHCYVNQKIIKRTPSSFIYSVVCWPEKRNFIKKYGHSEEEWRELFVQE